MKNTRWKLATIAAVLSLLATLLATGSNPATASPVYACDINGDLASDLPVGVPNYDNEVRDDGAVFFYTGSPQGLQPVTSIIKSGANEFLKMGQVLMCVDIDQDGFMDLVGGVPFANVGSAEFAGEVFIVYGSAAGLNFNRIEVIDQSTPGVADRPQDRDIFGSDLSWGDFNRDGFPDLVIGVPGEDVSGRSKAGKVHVLYGSAEGIIDDQSNAASGFVISQDSRGIKGRANVEDRFGAAVWAEDFDRDGFVDLAVGVPREDVNGHPDAGAVNVIYGDGLGLGTRDQYIHQDRKNVPGSAEDNDLFGAPLVGGGIFDMGLIVGVPGEDIGSKEDAGLVLILASTSNGLTGNGGEVWHRGTPGIRGAVSAGDQFGHSLQFGVFDDDLNWDLAIGVPGDDVSGRRDAGSVHIIFGDGRGLSRADQIIHQDSPGIPGKAQRNDRFGSTLAVGWFHLGNARTGLAVGVPREDVDGVNDAGAVLVLQGGNAGLRGAGAVILTGEDIDEDRPSVKDNFGNFNAPLLGFGGQTASDASLPAGGELAGTEGRYQQGPK